MLTPFDAATKESRDPMMEMTSSDRKLKLFAGGRLRVGRYSLNNQ